MKNEVTDCESHLGYEILRNQVLPSILGKHEDDILYWAGKEVARQFPIFSMDELPEFFNQAGWGTLTIQEEKENTIIFRVDRSNDTTFQASSCQLEAGFIAEQHQQLTKQLTECYGTKHIKEEIVTYEMKWDARETLD